MGLTGEWRVWLICLHHFISLAFLVASSRSFDRICSIAAIMRGLFRRGDGRFHGPRVDGFDLIGLESDT